MNAAPVRVRAAAELERRRRKAAQSVAPAPDICEWIETQFYIPERQHESNPAMTLEPYQRAVLREAERRDAAGKFVYDLVLWSDIKKSAKSTIAAAVVLYRALHTEWGSFKIVANDLKQADSRVAFYIRRALELNKALGKRATIRNYKITLDNHSTIEAIPVDPKGEAGGNDDMIEFTELHASESKAALKMWTETTIPPTKHGYAQRWIDTYAGNSGESPILEPLYEQIVKQGQRLTLPGAPDGLEVFANGRLLGLWNTKPRMSWQTPEYYESEARVLLPNEFQRVHRNQWTTSEEVFVPREWWLSCYRADISPIGKHTPMVLAMDAAVSGDCFAIVGVSIENGHTIVRYVRTWKPAHGEKLNYAEQEAELRRLFTLYNVIEVCYDPYQLHDMTTRLSGLAWFNAFNQGADRLIADKLLRDCIQERRLAHSNEPDLTEHITNANAKAEGEKLRIVKRAEAMKIDACVALSMANHEVRRLNL